MFDLAQAEDLSDPLSAELSTASPGAWRRGSRKLDASQGLCSSCLATISNAFQGWRISADHALTLTKVLFIMPAATRLTVPSRHTIHGQGIHRHKAWQSTTSEGTE